MILNMPCSYCQTYNKIEILARDNIHYTCKNGHNFYTYLSMPMYPLFFQYGLTSFIEKKYFESYISLYKSYEMFIYEFVKIFLLFPGESIVYDEKRYKTISKFLKTNLKNSSVLKGAFDALYFNEFGTLPANLDSLSSIRNKFVHADEIVTEDTCIKLANGVAKFIKPIEKTMLLSGTPGKYKLTLASLSDYTANTDKYPISLQSQDMELWVGRLKLSNFDNMIINAEKYNNL